MKKNLRSCVEQPQFGESVRLLDFSDPAVVSSSGLSPDPSRARTLLWRFSERDVVRFPLYRRDLSGSRFLTFSVWAVSGAGGTFSLRFESNDVADGAGCYACILPITHNGWNDYRVDLPFLAAEHDPAGWDRIDAVVLDAVAGGQSNRPETALSVGELTLWKGVAPYLYIKRPELKGAAVFSRTGAFAIVDRKRVPLAPDADLSVKPFELNGTVWVPMAPVAAVLGHTAVADNKAATLNFVYRRKKYTFTTESRYTEDGERKPLSFLPRAVRGTLFFPVDFVREFFRWRQTFTDPTGLLILSNRKQIFDRALESPFLWNLCAELTVARRNGREILDDVRRKTPTASRGRLLLLHDGWITLRKLCREDPVLSEQLRELKATCGRKSDVFSAEPVFSLPAASVTDRAAQYRLASGRVIRFAALYRLTGEKPYAERVWRETEALAALPSWNADTDLVSAAITAFGVAIGYDWCHPSWNESRKMKVERALLRFALRPGLDACCGRSAAWRQDPASSAQIHAGILASALVLADAYPETVYKVLDRAPANIAKCFSAYAPDGGFATGVGDWEKATGALVSVLSMLESACGTTYGLDSLPGFQQTALFGVIASTQHGAWHADHLPDTSFLPWFTQHYHTPIPAWIRRRELRTGQKSFHVRDLIFHVPVEENATVELPLDAVYRKAGLAVLRSDWSDRATCLTLHGGSNTIDRIADAGAIFMESEGEPFFTDAGTLTVEGEATGQNPFANAALLEVRGAADRAYAVVDLSEISPAILRGKRGVQLCGARQIAVVQDELTVRQPTTFLWNAVTPAKVAVLRTRYAILEQNGRRLICRFSGAAGKWEAEPIPETGLTRLFVRFRVNRAVRFAVFCKPYREAKDRNEPFYEVRPIAKWSESGEENSG